MASIDSGRIYAIVTVFIGFIIVASVLIPVVLDMARQNDTGAGTDMRVGQTFVYVPELNIPGAVISVSGDAMDYGSFSDGEVKIKWEDAGTYTLVITAETYHPYQTATQTITFDVGEKESSDNIILLVVPTVMIVGLLVYALRRVGGFGIDVDGDTRIGGGDFLDSGTRGFGKR